MPLSTEQKATIRRIAKEQLESYLRIVDKKMYEKIKQEMIEEGYDVNDSDIMEHFAKEMELWDALIDTPEAFLQRLDDLNLSVLKHILLNEFELTPTTRGIWKQLNLFDKVNKFQN